MKKRVLILIFCAIHLYSNAQKTTFNIKYSEQLAVFVFLQNLTKNYPQNVFKVEFQKSKYNIIEFQKEIATFEKMAIDFSYQFEEYPNGSKMPMQSRDILRKNLIATSNLNDFKLQSVGIVPNKTLIDLTKIIIDFTPIYNELIYNPNKEQFENQLLAIKKYSVDNNIEKYFETGLTFYNASWDNSIPFEIAFYPLPNSQGFTAQAFCNNFISAIQTNLKSYKDLFSVILHETFHVVYNEQSLEIKIEIDKCFKENKLKSSNYAYQILNEALATSLGNGYVFENIDNKIDDGDWYNQKYINQIAKKIYPLVTEYILQKKSMDKNFIDQYINIYETNFPNWINELDNIMSYKYVISENPNDFDSIERKFRHTSNSEFEQEITKSGIEKMQKSSLTKIIVVSNKNNENLKLIKQSFKELKNWKFNPESEFNHKILLDDKSQLLIINQKKSSLEILLGK